MSKKLSRKEREEMVTKGYLHDYVDERLAQTERNLGALIEAQNDKLQMFAEAVMGRFEILEKKLESFN